MPSSSQSLSAPPRSARCKANPASAQNGSWIDVVVELVGGVVEVVQPVDDEHGNERADAAEQRPRHGEDRGEGRDHRDLRQQVIGEVVPDQPVGGLGQPPRQRRQLVVAELPFAAVDQRLDQVERQIGVEQRRQCRPHRRMQQRKGGECLARRGLDPANECESRGRPPSWPRFANRAGLLQISGELAGPQQDVACCADPWRHEHWRGQRESPKAT